MAQSAPKGYLPAVKTAIGAGALLGLGSVLPWVSIPTVFGTLSVDGTSVDGVLTLICAVVAVVFGLFLLQSRWTGWLLGTGIAFAAGASIAGYDMSTISTATSRPEVRYFGIDIGVGLWLCLVAAIVGLAASFTALVTVRSIVTFGVPSRDLESLLFASGPRGEKPNPTEVRAAAYPPPTEPPPAGDPSRRRTPHDEPDLPPAGTPAGWRRDPLGVHVYRYFDGVGWTEWVNNGEFTTVAQL